MWWEFHFALTQTLIQLSLQKFLQIIQLSLQKILHIVRQRSMGKILLRHGHIWIVMEKLLVKWAPDRFH